MVRECFHEKFTERTCSNTSYTINKEKTASHLIFVDTKKREKKEKRKRKEREKEKEKKRKEKKGPLHTAAQAAVLRARTRALPGPLPLVCSPCVCPRASPRTLLGAP